MSAIPGVRSIIGVGSGKGGVGKSTVAVNLAIALTEMGASTGLLDADLYGPSIPTMMGVNTRPELDAQERIVPLVSHQVKLISIGFMVHDGEAIIWRGPLLDQVIKSFTHGVVWGDLDFLIVDLPPGTGDVPLSLAQAVPLTGAVVVTTSQEVALADVIRCIALFQEINVPVLGVVENMSGLVCPHCHGQVALFTPGGGKEIAHRLGIPLLGQIPFDPQIAMCGDMGLPSVLALPDTPQSGAFRQIAHSIMARIENRSASLPSS